MSENPISNDRSKHIDYRVHALRERVKAGIVRLVDCETTNMVADPMTKNLAAPVFERHRAVMLGTARHTAPQIPSDLTIGGLRVFPSSVKRPTPTLPVKAFVPNPYTAKTPSYHYHKL